MVTSMVLRDIVKPWYRPPSYTSSNRIINNNMRIGRFVLMRVRGE